MRCEDVQARLADYLAGTLTSATHEVTQHLRACSACAAEISDLQDTWQLLATIPSEPPDSAGMRARFDAAIAEHDGHLDERFRPQAESVAYPARGWRARSLAPITAAAALLVGILVGRQLTKPLQHDPEISALRQEVHDMREKITLSLMQQASASERLKGVTSTERIDQAGSEVVMALLDTLMHDPNVNVRLASVDALKRFGERDVVRRGAIDALPQQTSPLVQIALIDFLVEVNGRESAGMLRKLSQDLMLDEVVRIRAAMGLKQVG